MVAYVIYMSWVVGSVMPRSMRSIPKLQLLSKWLPAGELVSLLVEKKAAIEAECKAATVLTLAQARALHDICMACLLFGWLPPIRGQCIRLLQSPHHNLPCALYPHQGCRDPHCKGNKLVPLGDGLFKLHLPHFKTRKFTQDLSLVLPADLSALLSLYMVKGCHVLRQHKADASAEHGFMFMNTLGRAFSITSFVKYYQNLMQSWGGVSISPGILRHIFVEERMSSDPAPGPSNTDAAHCMTHSELMWKAYYDLGLQSREAQRAIGAMAEWRDTLKAMTDRG